MSDYLILAACFLYAGLVLGLAQVLHRRGWGAEATRKLVHIAVGHIAIPLVAWVQAQSLAVAAPTAFVGINYLAWRRGLLPGMDAQERPTLGTVYFPASLALMLLFLWPSPYRLLILAAMMLMTWGDGLSAVVGQRRGRHTWSVAGETKSLEGSLTVLGAGFASTFAALWAAGQLWPALALRPLDVYPAAEGAAAAGPLGPGMLAALSLLLAVVAALLEAISIRGTDNLSVPLGSAAVGLALLYHTPSSWLGLAWGLAAAGLIGWLAYRRQALTVSGALGATLLGGIIFAFGGWVWGLLLVTFFVSSSLLTGYRHGEKRSLGEKFAKTGPRDALQTLANGGLGAALAVAYAIRPSVWLVAGFLGAMATVNADTWATEVGSLSRTPPRLITTWRPVARGTSGGISLAGTLAAAAGALLVGAVAWAALPWRTAPGSLVLVVTATLGGAVGAMADSLLGATVQAVYWCPYCQVETEQAVHRCGTPTERTRGWPWLGNDLVNLTSSAAGALAAILVLFLMAPLTYRAIDANAAQPAGRTVPATAPAPAPTAQEQQLAMLRLMFPTEGITATDGGFVDQTGRVAYTIERDATGSFTGPGAAERLLAVTRPGQAHAEGFYHLYTAVFDTAGTQLKSDVLHLSADEGTWDLWEGQGVGHLVFVGYTMYQGWADYTGGIWRASPTWTETWPRNPGFWRRSAANPPLPDRGAQIGPGELRLLSRVFLGRTQPGQAIPQYSFVQTDTLRWNPQTATLEPDPATP